MLSVIGESLFPIRRKYTMANNTFRFIQRQYAEDEALMTEVSIWLFRSPDGNGTLRRGCPDHGPLLDGSTLKRKQREMVAAARTDFYVRQGMYEQAIPEGRKIGQDL